MTETPGNEEPLRKMHPVGASSVSDDNTGNVHLTLPHFGTVIESNPVVYQGTPQNHISSGVTLNGTSAHIDVGSYDHTKPLIIDPTLEFSTYLGGSFADTLDGVATDPAGDIYIGGTSYSTNFPTYDAYDSSLGSGSNCDGVAVKLTPGGGSYVYSTYFGPGYSTFINGISIDSSGDAYLTGETDSTSFPTTTGAYQTSLPGTDSGFVTKFDSAGDALDYSTYLGGTGSSSAGYFNAIAVNRQGNAYVVGKTDATNYPTHNAIQSSNGGGYDIALTELSTSGGSLVYSTYLGGSGDDVGLGIALDASGDAYIAGYANSSGLATSGAYQTSFASGYFHSIVYKINSAGSAVDWATYLGGSNADLAVGILVDPNGNVFGLFALDRVRYMARAQIVITRI